jgi:transcriptional regulator NrdR family protein
MKCPACSSSRIRTITTRQWDDTSVMRQRRCAVCREKWLTLEEIRCGTISFATFPPTIELEHVE